MADRNVIGMAMEMDVTDITSGLAQVSKAITQSNTDFKKATAGMDNWSKTSEGLTAKLEQLTTNLELQKKGASGLEAEIERLKNSEGDHSAEIERAQKKLDGYQIQIANTEKEIRKYTTALENTQKQEKQNQSASGTLTDKLKEQKSELSDLEKEYKDAVLTYGKNSKEAQELGAKIKSLSKSIDDNESQVDEANKAYKELTDTLDDNQDEVEDSEKSYTSLGDVLEGLKSVSVVAVGAVTGVVTAVVKLGKSFLDTAESTRELRTNMAKVNSSFEQAGFSAYTAKKTYDNFFAVLGNESNTTEAVSHLSKLVTTEEELSQWTNICAGVYALFGDSIPIQGLAEASNETAKTGELTGQLGDALKRVGISEDDFKAQLAECNTEQERSVLITNTLNSLYAETGRRYKENNADIIEANEANLRLSKAMAEIGEIAEPLQRKITNLKASFMEFAGEVVKALSGQKITSDDLSLALDTLKISTENVKKAQDEMKISLDETSKSSYFQSQVALYSAIDTVADSYKKASEQSLKYRQELMDAQKAIRVYGQYVNKAVNETGLSFDELYEKYILYQQGVIDVGDVFTSGIYEDKIIMMEAIGDYQEALKAEEDVRSKFTGWEKTLGNYVAVLADIVSSGSVSLETISLYSKELGEDIKEYLAYSNEATGKIVSNNNTVASSTENVVTANENVGLSAEEAQKATEEAQRRGISQTEYYSKQIERQSEEQIKATEEAQKKAQKLCEDAQERGRKLTEYYRGQFATDTKKGWSKFVSNIKEAVDEADKALSNWQNGTGAYIKKIGNALSTAEGYISNLASAWGDYANQRLENQKTQLEKEYNEEVEANEVRKTELENNASEILKTLETQYNEEIIALKNRLQKGEITEEQYTTLKEKRDEDYAKSKTTTETNLAKALDDIRVQQEASRKAMIAEQNRIGEEQFEANKKTQIASIAVNTASAIIKAYAELGWIAGTVAAVALGATAAAQIATIEEQEYIPVTLAKGGITQGATQAIIGEDGREAVLPLEKNTGWIDLLAQKLNTVMVKENDINNFASYGTRNISNNFTQIINAPKTPSRRELYRDGKNLLALKGIN